ncbi:hypothetical protein M0R45_034984 [Rubus argutus]|uniref:Uncharacterized protein n=1 Tax=Rubus argutus TaxID=59490 RepID=A0AAW1VTF8_RUBAR
MSMLALLVKSIGEAAAEEQQVLVAALDLQVFTKRMKAVHKVDFDDFIDKTVEEHLQSRVRSWRKKNQALC